MRTFFLFLLYSLTLLSCNKKNNSPPESQGTNFIRLLKTVTTTDAGTITTETYTYNGSGLLTGSQRITPASSGNTADIFTQAFYRNSSGKPDSITVAGTRADTFYYKTFTRFYYDFAGKLSYSVNRTYIPNTTTINSRDSSVYFYSGNVVEHRDDYSSAGAGPYGARSRQLFYQYDAAGNLSSLRAEVVDAGTIPPGLIINTSLYTYDNNSNPLPDNRSLYFSLVTLFYYDYKSVNNPVIVDNGNWGTKYTYEYRFSANNKPLYRKGKETGTTHFTEALFYYD